LLEALSTSKHQECPNCQAIVPVHEGFVTWCDRCGWNINPGQLEQSQNPFRIAYRRLGQTQSQALLEYYTEVKSLRPSLTISKILAGVAAATIHAITLGFAAPGITLIVLGWPYLVAIAGGLLCLGMAWFLRPRPAKVPDGIVSRAEFAALYHLVDSVANLLNAPAVDGIVVNEDFNASYGQFGWRRKGVLSIGLPLWVLLDDEERVALIAHELAHSVNGDAARGFFIATAMSTLENWYTLLLPSYIVSPLGSVVGSATEISRWALLALSKLLLFGAYLLSHLLWRESQRAEHLADYLASTVSGTTAMLSLIDKFHLRKACALTVQRAALNRESESTLLEELHRRAMEVPARERERIKRVQQLEGARLDVAHPPTAYRIRLLEKFFVPKPEGTWLASEFEHVDSELTTLGDKVQRKLVDSYRAALYARPR
jgi:Zn-dependent protease with chaperone function